MMGRAGVVVEEPTVVSVSADSVIAAAAAWRRGGGGVETRRRRRIALARVLRRRRGGEARAALIPSQDFRVSVGQLPHHGVNIYNDQHKLHTYMCVEIHDRILQLDLF
jgi:hypothetical protein